jgi:hypothetical protein
VEDHGVTPRTCSLSLYSEDERGERRGRGAEGVWAGGGLGCRLGLVQQKKRKGTGQRRKGRPRGERGVFIFKIPFPFLFQTVLQKDLKIVQINLEFE